MSEQRAKIRVYIDALFKSGVDVGGRVFFAQPDPRFLDELPCVIWGFAGEDVDILDGDRYQPARYLRTLEMNVDVITAGGIDHLDYLSAQVENVIFTDHMLAKKLPGYNAENPDRLCCGISMKSCSPYIIKVEGETEMIMERITFSIPYIQPTDGDRKLDNFEQFAFSITRPEDGVELIAGEVNL